MKAVVSFDFNSAPQKPDGKKAEGQKIAGWRRAASTILLLGALQAGANSEGVTSPSPGATSIFNAGDLLFTDSAAALMRYNARTGETSPLLSEGLLVRPFGIAIGGDQTIYVSDTGCLGVIAINSRTGKARLLASGRLLGTPFGIAVGPKNEIYVVNGQSVIAINPISGAQRLVSMGGLLQAPLGLVSAPNGELFVADAGGSVVRIQPGTGRQKLVASGLYLISPTGITMFGSDHLYVADSSSRRIVRVDATTGQQVLVAADGNLATPVGLALMGRYDLLVGDPDAFDLAGGIIHVDLRSGTQTRILCGIGDFVNPRCVVVIPEIPERPRMSTFKR